MDWVFRSPQIHSTFGSLGFAHNDGYHINENCNAALETILHNILTEDKFLRTYRRSISFGQNIDKDLIPLLLYAKEDKTIELLVRILVNLTIPIECLLSVSVISETDFGRHTVFEINNLLSSTKVAFTDHRATKVIIEFLKKNTGSNQQGELYEEQCTNVSNSLLLLRNILHIPEEPSSFGPSYNGPSHTVQNQILWNIFSQSIDKILIKLMSIPEATHWGVTMVQLIALLYKDQHVATLQKLLNLWLESSLPETSEDNESNTSPPNRGSEDSSPMITSDPTSDSSGDSSPDGSGKCNGEPNSVNNVWGVSAVNNKSENENQTLQPSPITDKQPEETPKTQLMETNCDEQMKIDNDKDRRSGNSKKDATNHKNDKKTVISENSDCGYGTQIENQESISTSSNEDDVPANKPVHQKPHNPKQRTNTNKARAAVSLQEKKRKKIVKRGKCNIINVHGLSHKTPTDDDVANILKEFTVDFLLKGYNSLIQTLHSQILTNLKLEIDISHFFWLVTYFLKFATQIELDLEHVGSVLSYDVISYLTAEGVNLCEQFELAIKLDGNDLKPSIRRLHLVVTAIREFVQAMEVYKKFTHIAGEEKEALVTLQIKMCETEELRSLMVLLLRHYNPKYHSKLYLQDLIVTNHILLVLLDSGAKLPGHNGSLNMTDHLKQFATPEIMHKYGLLLEDYASNGEFVNDCIFTLMHHVGGELGCLITLFQPKILKTFTSIWKSEFEICDDWSDLIEYVINTFIKKPDALNSSANVWLDSESFGGDKILPKAPVTQTKIEAQDTENKKKQNGSNSSKDRWTEDELSSLSWNYMKCNTSPDVVGEIIKLFEEDGIKKSRNSVIRELRKQKLINKDEFDKVANRESERNAKKVQAAKEARDKEISKLCEQLAQDGKSKFLAWVQNVLLDTCFVKICLDKKSTQKCGEIPNEEVTGLNFEFSKKNNDLPVISPISYHSLLSEKSVPLVPWNSEQTAICKDLKFLQLLHKLGFQMPVDTGKVFIRIPHLWTADYLYDTASKIGPIDMTKLKFSVNDIRSESKSPSSTEDNYISPVLSDITMVPPTDKLYQIHKQTHIAVLNYTPMPGSSFHSDVDETNKQNWLELVQKSQEVALVLSLKRSASQVEEEVRVEDVTFAAPLPVFGDPPTGIMSPKHDEPDVELLPEPESCNNSVCETASVASDLTRMYVSDEDDKSELVLRPLREGAALLMATDPCPEPEPEPDYDVNLASAESDNSIAEKRQRMQ